MDLACILLPSVHAVILVLAFWLGREVMIPAAIVTRIGLAHAATPGAIVARIGFANAAMRKSP